LLELVSLSFVRGACLNVADMALGDQEAAALAASSCDEADLQRPINQHERHLDPWRRSWCLLIGVAISVGTYGGWAISSAKLAVPVQTSSAGAGSVGLSSVDGKVFEPEPELPHPIAGGRTPGAWLRNATSRSTAPGRGLLLNSNCLPDCPALSEQLKKYTVRPAKDAPGRFDLDLGFYTKYIDVMGIPVISSGRLSDCVLQKAAWIVHGTLSHLRRRKEVIGHMVRARSRVAIMAKTEVTTDVPEHATLSPKDFWDSRARGLGATRSRPCSSGAEESVMCESWHTNGYYGENILLHEFVHGIARTGLNFMKWGGKAWDTYNGQVYESSKRRGLWAGTYAITNKIEYFAEAVQSWFDTNLKAACCNKETQCNDGIHNCISTREALKSYDRTLYDHVAKIFVEDGWRPGQGPSCGCAAKDRLIEGFAPLAGIDDDDDGSNAGGDDNSDGDETENVVPVERCAKALIPSICRREVGCKWIFDSCRVDCAGLRSSSSCRQPGTCSWREGAGCSDCVPHKDTHRHCESWASQGECDRNPGWMHKNCRLACTSDKHRHCESWAQRGECHRNSGYMLQFCPSSCSCSMLMG